MAFAYDLWDEGKEIWVGPSGLSGFDKGNDYQTMVTGDRVSIAVPTSTNNPYSGNKYKLFVLEDGVVTSQSDATITVGETEFNLEPDVWFSADHGVTTDEQGRVTGWASQGKVEGLQAVGGTYNTSLPTMQAINGSKKPAVGFKNSHMTFEYPLNGKRNVSIVSYSAHTGTGGGDMRDSVVTWNQSGDWGMVFLVSQTDRAGYRFGTGAANTNNNWARTPAITSDTYSVTAITKAGGSGGATQTQSTERLYVNGAQVHSVSNRRNEIANVQDVANFGRTNTGGSSNTTDYTTNNIAEFMVFDHTLSTEEIAHIQEFIEAKYFASDGKDLLRLMVETAEQFIDGDFDEVFLTRLENALTAADKVLKDIDATQDMIDDAYYALRNAVYADEETDIVLSELLSLYNGLGSTDAEPFTTSSWTRFEEALAEAEKMLINAAVLEGEATGRWPTLADATAMKNTVWDAYFGLQTRGNTTVLSIIYNNHLKHYAQQEAYTEESFNAFHEVMEAVAAILKDPSDASTADILAAQNAMSTAAKALKFVDSEANVNLSALNVYIRVAENLLKNPNLTPSATKALEEALEEAIALRDSTNKTQVEVNEMSAKLLAAIVASYERGDKTLLEELVAAAKMLNEEQYKADSWADLKKALEIAENVLANEDAVQELIDGAFDKLANAIEGLKLNTNVNKSALWFTIGQANDILDNVGLYVYSSLEGLDHYRVLAVRVAEDEDATQEDVDNATTALAEKVANARLKADLTALRGVMARVEMLNFNLYTQPSVERVMKAMTDAGKMDEESDQDDVDAATKALEDAIKDLVLKTTIGDGGNPDNGGGSEDGNQAGGGNNTGNTGNTGNKENANSGNSSGNTAAAVTPRRILRTPTVNEPVQDETETDVPADDTPEIPTAAMPEADDETLEPEPVALAKPADADAGQKTNLLWLAIALVLIAAACGTGLLVSKKRKNRT